MKTILKFPLIVLLVGVLVHLSCKKESSCENCRETNKPPVANAGPDQAITLPTDSVLLDGSASSDPDGTISNWLWTKISGPTSFLINNSSTSNSSVKNLIKGVYQLELKVTDNRGLSAKDTIQVIVNDPSQPNRPPIANAGADQTITLPANSLTVDGSGSTDPDNNIISYTWTKISGPSSFNIANANTVQTQVTNLIQGTYRFELKVTDAGGLFSKDTIQVTVTPQLPPPPACDNSNRPLVTAQLIPIGALSQARTAIAVASAENKIFFAGGINNSLPSSRVDIYDLTTRSWSTAELSLGRVWIGAVSAGSKIFFAGGQNDGWSLDIVDIYDVSSNTWTISHLSRGADALAAATMGDKVFFAGGNWGVGATDLVDIYNLTANTWSTAHLSAQRNFITAASANNKVFFAGGYSANWQTSNVIDVYDNITGTWSTSTLQIPRSYHAGVAFNDVVYFAGADPANCSVETLDANTGGRTLMNLSNPSGWFPDAGRNAIVRNNKIIFLRHDGGAYANKFDIYDPQNTTWSIGVLPQPIPDGASVISANNTIYVAGGLINGVLSNQVWKLEF